MKIHVSRLLITLFISVLISGCSNKSEMLIGNVYTFQDDSLRFVAGFDKDTLFFTVKDLLRDSLKVASHKSKYTIKKINDSTFIIELSTKPKFWETNTWEIVIDNNNGLYSAGSKRYYKKTIGKDLVK